MFGPAPSGSRSRRSRPARRLRLTDVARPCRWENQPSHAIPIAPVRPTILLFDIDGTLITTGGVGRRAMEGAFAERHGEYETSTSFRFDGMTDRSIARKGLTILGIEPTDAAIADLLDAYVRLLEVEVARADDAKYRLHTGITEALVV